jgi:hypothetical protein
MDFRVMAMAFEHLPRRMSGKMPYVSTCQDLAVHPLHCKQAVTYERIVNKCGLKFAVMFHQAKCDLSVIRMAP